MNPGHLGTSLANDSTNPLMGFCSDQAKPRVLTDATNAYLVLNIRSQVSAPRHADPQDLQTNVHPQPGAAVLRGSLFLTCWFMHAALIARELVLVNPHVADLLRAQRCNTYSLLYP